MRFWRSLGHLVRGLAAGFVGRSKGVAVHQGSNIVINTIARGRKEGEEGWVEEYEGTTGRRRREQKWCGGVSVFCGISGFVVQWTCGSVVYRMLQRF